MIKLTLETDVKDKPIVQRVKVVAVPAFTKAGFKIVEESHTLKEMKAWMDNNNIKYGAKENAMQLAKRL